MRGWEHVTPADLGARRPIAGVCTRQGEEIAARVGKSAQSKYHAVRTRVDGFVFDSKREAERYQVLLVRGRVGHLTNLELQPSYPLIVAGVTVGTYRADFAYDTGGCHVVEDVKGMRTPVYRLKKKIVEALYGFKIQEIR